MILTAENADLEVNSKRFRELQNLIEAHNQVFSKNDTDICWYVNNEGYSGPLVIKAKDPIKTLIAKPRRIPFEHRKWLENHLKELS